MGSALTILAGAVVVGGLAGAAVAQQLSGPHGTVTAGSPHVVNLSELPQVTAPQAAQAHLALRPQNGLSDTAYGARKAQAGKSSQIAASAESSIVNPSAASAPQGGGLETPVASPIFDAQNMNICGGWVPADMGLAVGDNVPTYPVLQANNDCLSIFTKTGTMAPGYPKSLQAFAGLPGGQFVSDPRALYDWTNHRYIVTFLDTDLDSNSNCRVCTSYYDLAVSTGDDPGGTWYVYRIATPTGGNRLNDFPRVGQDHQAIYLASNLFQMNGSCCGNYIYEEWLFVSKQQVYSGTLPLSGYFFANPQYQGISLDTTQPVNVYNPTDNPRAEYLVTSLNINFGGGQCFAGCNGLVVWAISNPLVASGSPGPEITGKFIATANNYALPPSASQPGGGGTIDTGDTRISGEVTYNAGLLYAALNSASGSSNVASILYKVYPTLNRNDDTHCPSSGAFYNLCPQLTSATILDETVLGPTVTSNAAVYYPTMQPDPEGNNTTVFNYSDPFTYPGTAYISRRVSTPPHVFFDGGAFAQAGKGFYLYGRWGDYTAVAPAGLAVGGTPFMWFSGMYSGVSGRWRSIIARNGFTALNQY